MSDDLVKRLQTPRPMSMFLTRADQAKDWTELLHEAADRISELEAKHQEAFQMYVDANEARIDAEAERDALAERLAKAVRALRGWIDFANAEGMPVLLSDLEAAELTGGKDD